MNFIVSSTMKSRGLREQIWKGLIIFGCFTSLMSFLPNLDILRFENSLPVFDYQKYLFYFILLTIFAFIVPLWYGINTYRPYLLYYRKEYGISSFHYIFLGVTFGAFLGMVSIVIYTFIVGFTNQLVELSLTIIFSTMVIFPTVRWTYLSLYYRRVIEIDGQKLLDVINHDLTNITHILLVALDMNERSTMNEDDISLLIRQVERMGELLDKARSYENPDLYESLDQA